MSNDNDIILSSATSMSTLTINEVSKDGFGYNPSVGPQSNIITPEASTFLLSSKKSIITNNPNSIYDKNIINKKNLEISLSSLAFLFCEMVNWCHSNSKGIQDLETRLNGLGYQVGQRYIELIKLREGFKTNKREVKIVEILQFIHGTFWKAIFGKTANELEKSQDVLNEYMITDNVPLMSKFISIPKEYGELNCSAFMAGIIEGALDSSAFFANVTAHSVPITGYPLRTVFLIKFDDSLSIRESLRS
ncbi:transport protein particle complex subunit [Scheffersomyces amazonensis]|uniref:transport protein particle complex subunit n=1 Tax=Scheffersomyces amazonensis TaxID=1078765 RepID=UPI00315CDEC5